MQLIGFYFTSNQLQGRAYFFHRSSTLQPKGFSDSNWEACPDITKSIIGYYVFWGFPNILEVHKATYSLRSSTESEYRTMAAISEVTLLKYLVGDL